MNIVYCKNCISAIVHDITPMPMITVAPNSCYDVEPSIPMDCYCKRYKCKMSSDDFCSKGKLKHKDNYNFA